MEKLDQDKELLVAECGSALDALSAARKAGACLMLLHVASEADARRHISLQKPLLQQIKRGEVRIILTYLKGAEQNAKWLASQLQADAVMEPVALKSLVFKIERYAKALAKMTDPAAASQQQQQAGAAAGAQQGAPGAKNARGGKESTLLRQRNQAAGTDPQLPVRMGKALTLESDIWATMKNGFKFQGGRWTVQLKGPPPLLGEWVRYSEGKVKLSSQKENKLWVWVPKAIPEDVKIDPLIKEEGQWIFLGSQPKFQGNYWYFISAKPVLGFFYGSDSFGNKLELDEEGVLNVASDSQDALTTLTLLETVLAERKAADVKAAKAQNRTGISEKSKAEEAAEAARSTFVMVDPIRLASDCFILGKEKPRRVTRKWVVSLMGPPPDTGKWIAAEVKKSETNRRSDDGYWRWEPVDPERDLFIKEEGSWVFRGIQPRFIGNQWIFTAVQPELAFYCDGEAKGSKLLTRPDGSLAVAKDSDVAKAFVPVIEASLEKVVKAKTVGKKGDDEGSLEGAKETRMPKETFGEGGDWAFVTRESGRRLYVYLPQELIEGKVADPRKMPVYWTQSGSEKPELLLGNEGEEYLFRGQEPKKYERFADLPDPVRELLGDKLGSAENVKKFLEESKEAEKKAAVAEADAESAADEVIHKIPKARVSDKNGGWEVADSGSQGRRWFVFLPSDYNADDPEAYKSFKTYWTYFGQKVPRSLAEDGTEYWTFAGREPVEVTNFGDLPVPVQNYFRASSQMLAEAEEAEARRKEEDDLLFGSGAKGGADDEETLLAGGPGRKKRKGGSEGENAGEDDEDLFTIKGRKASKVTEFEAEISADKKKSKELEIELDEEEATELNGRFKKDKARDLKDGRGEDEDAEGEELSLDLRKDKKKGGKDGKFAAEDEGAELSFRDRKKKSKDAKDGRFGDEEESAELEGPEADEEDEGVDFDDLFEKEGGKGVKKKARKKDTKGAKEEDEDEDESDTDGSGAKSGRKRDPADGDGEDDSPDAALAGAAAKKKKKDSGEEAGDEEGGDGADARNSDKSDDTDDATATPEEKAARKAAREKAAAEKAKAEAEAEAKKAAKEKARVENAEDENAGEEKKAQDDRASRPEVRHGKPVKPSLSPLSIAFLMSELQAKRDPLEPSRGMSADKIGHRFCNYVSKAVGEIRVELWARGTDRWYCSGTFDNEPGMLTPLFGPLPANPDLGPVPYGTQSVFLVPVTEKPGAPAGSPAVGAIVFMGEGVDQIDVKWAFAVGNMARGLLITLSRRASTGHDAEDEAEEKAA